MAMPALAWSAAIFGRNEAASIGACIAALAAAAEGRALHLTIVLNGTTDESHREASLALIHSGLPGRIHAIAEADKANAVNQFIQHLRPEAETYFFVDAYARVAPDALCLLDQALRDQPMAQAAAAVPATGRSAARLRAEMIRNPGLHGSLFALRGSFVARMAAQGLALPVGLYRGDGLLGSFVLHDLDAVDGGWRGERIAVEPRANWAAPQLQPWRWRDVRRHWNRLIQQGRGRLQWSAIRARIYPHGFGALPADADDCVLEGLDAARAPKPWRDPFAALALARMRRARPRQSLTPRLLSEWNAR